MLIYFVRLANIKCYMFVLRKYIPLCNYYLQLSRYYVRSDGKQKSIEIDEQKYFLLYTQVL